MIVFHTASSDLEVYMAGGAYTCIGLEPESTGEVEREREREEKWKNRGRV